MSTRTNRLHALRATMLERILVTDGAMGTMIQAADLNEADFRGTHFDNQEVDLFGNNDVLSITRADVIKNIHRRYLDAGADLICTNTSNSNPVSQADYALESRSRDLNVAGAQVARAAADAVAAESGRPRFVAGVLDPTNRTASISPDVNDPAKRNMNPADRFGEVEVKSGSTVKNKLDVDATSGNMAFESSAYVKRYL